MNRFRVWHWLRGHKLRRFTRDAMWTSGPPGGLTRGFIYRGTECSCNTTWFD